MATDPARLTTPERTPEDADSALRPKSLDEFIGQQGARENLRIFIAGNLPMKTQITPVMIMGQLEQYRYAEATAIAVVMLVASFVLLLAINLLQRWTTRRMAM